ncbi:MAG: hypothetical protein A3F18_08735 [Legionellales bacterium RIFCSPHIGHO2_12_FULL_37_14]|nr:MAG: hypothetical protein A3F18_08735 [Legionellales bacterium RIFCSPHIGHO2_12_FULL_37_14]
MNIGIQRADPLLHVKSQQVACLLGSLITNIVRELKDYDFYFRGQVTTKNGNPPTFFQSSLKVQLADKETEDGRYTLAHPNHSNLFFKRTDWSITAQVYDRIIDPLVYRMRTKYFLRDFLGEQKHEIVGGLFSGVIIGGGMLAFTAVTALSLIAPWYLIAVACLPSLGYFIAGIKSFIEGFSELVNTQDKEHLLKAKMHFQRCIGSFLCALLLPFVLACVFPIELTRFIVRSFYTLLLCNLKEVFSNEIAFPQLVN